jgi:hypothetical protein
LSAESTSTSLAGYNFTQADVQQVVRLKATTAGDDQRLWTKKIKGIAKAEAWRNDPDGQYNDRFSAMTVGEFKEYLEKKSAEKKAGKRSEKKGKKDSKGKGKARDRDDKRKRRRSPSTDRGSASSSESDRDARKSKKKKKAVDSDNLDDSD